LVPVSILLAGVIVGGAILYASTSSQPSQDPSGTQQESATNQQQQQESTTAQISVPAPSDDDHIRGSLDATVTIVEYSDPECPFCKRFHGTMQSIMSEYDESQLAWVYRHFPIEQLHSQATTEAIALECAAQVGDNETFWEYTDTLYEETPSGNSLDLARLNEFAEQVGLDTGAFQQCRDGDEAAQAVSDDEQTLLENLPPQVRSQIGTPFSIIYVDGTPVDTIVGALPKQRVTATIDQYLN
jgi:protein-disulfide isomerase